MPIALPEVLEVVEIDGSPGAPGLCLVWRFESVRRGISSSIVGGGMGPVSWALNMTVDDDYSRYDPDQHLLDAADRLGLQGRGLAMMTAVAVSAFETAEVDGAVACATVGVSRPVWAADPSARHRTSRADTHRASTGADTDHDIEAPTARRPGTINLIVSLPARLTDAALVNAVSTATEAKVQALLDAGVDGTGTASDAVAIVCAPDGPAEQFGGPLSTWGSRLALAVYDATTAGITAQRA